jgi:hypothetical protein
MSSSVRARSAGTLVMLTLMTATACGGNNQAAIPTGESRPNVTASPAGQATTGVTSSPSSATDQSPCSLLTQPLAEQLIPGVQMGTNSDFNTTCIYVTANVPGSPASTVQLAKGPEKLYQVVEHSFLATDPQAQVSSVDGLGSEATLVAGQVTSVGGMGLAVLWKDKGLMLELLEVGGVKGDPGKTALLDVAHAVDQAL